MYNRYIIPVNISFHKMLHRSGSPECQEAFENAMGDLDSLDAEQHPGCRVQHLRVV